jgi:hypothetical protein
MAHAGEMFACSFAAHPQRHAAPAIRPHGRRPASIERGLDAVGQSLPGRTPPASPAQAGRRQDRTLLTIMSQSTSGSCHKTLNFLDFEEIAV